MAQEFKSKQHRLNEKPSKFKVKISNSEDYGGYVVEGMLPQDYGFTVGSEYAAPFDTASLSENMQRIFALAGIAQKQGIRMEKMYTNPEPTEISFDIELNAYYSAWDEVVRPIIFLTRMTLGSLVEWNDVDDNMKKLLNFADEQGQNINSFLGTEANTDPVTGAIRSGVDNEDAKQYGGKLLGLIGVIQSPNYVTVKFGDFMTWRNMYITSVAPRFSNVMDGDGHPLSATVSITVTPDRYPIADSMIDVFGSNGENF